MWHPHPSTTQPEREKKEWSRSVCLMAPPSTLAVLVHVVKWEEVRVSERKEMR